MAVLKDRNEYKKYGVPFLYDKKLQDAIIITPGMVAGPDPLNTRHPIDIIANLNLNHPDINERLVKGQWFLITSYKEFKPKPDKPLQIMIAVFQDDKAANFQDRWAFISAGAGASSIEFQSPKDFESTLPGADKMSLNEIEHELSRPANMDNIEDGTIVAIRTKNTANGKYTIVQVVRDNVAKRNILVTIADNEGKFPTTGLTADEEFNERVVKLSHEFVNHSVSAVSTIDEYKTRIAELKRVAESELISYPFNIQRFSGDSDGTSAPVWSSFPITDKAGIETVYQEALTKIYKWYFTTTHSTNGDDALDKLEKLIGVLQTDSSLTDADVVGKTIRVIDKDAIHIPRVGNKIENHMKTGYVMDIEYYKKRVTDFGDEVVIEKHNPDGSLEGKYKLDAATGIFNRITGTGSGTAPTIALPYPGRWNDKLFINFLNWKPNQNNAITSGGLPDEKWLKEAVSRGISISIQRSYEYWDSSSGISWAGSSCWIHDTHYGGGYANSYGMNSSTQQHPRGCYWATARSGVFGLNLYGSWKIDDPNSSKSQSSSSCSPFYINGNYTGYSVKDDASWSRSYTSGGTGYHATNYGVSYTNHFWSPTSSSWSYSGTSWSGGRNNTSMLAHIGGRLGRHGDSYHSINNSVYSFHANASSLSKWGPTYKTVTLTGLDDLKTRLVKLYQDLQNPENKHYIDTGHAIDLFQYGQWNRDNFAPINLPVFSEIPTFTEFVENKEEDYLHRFEYILTKGKWTGAKLDDSYQYNIDISKMNDKELGSLLYSWFDVLAGKAIYINGSTRTTNLVNVSDDSSSPTLADRAGNVIHPSTLNTSTNYIKLIANSGSRNHNLSLPAPATPDFEGHFSTILKEKDFLALRTTIAASAYILQVDITGLSLPGITAIGADAFADSPLTSLVARDATAIGDSAFEYIENKATTTVTIKSAFNSDSEKDRIFGKGNWDQIVFTFV